MIAATAAAHGPSALWYATRGAGAATLLLLTGSVVLGIAENQRWWPPRVPRFAVASLHRTLSLLALALLAVHVVTTLLDPFPKIGVLAAVVPLASSYRPLWLGLGAVALDLLVAVAITSLVRRRLGYRAWRGVHWLAYACWPVALVHGLGTGSDTRTAWMLALTAACAGAVLVALAGRLVDVAVPPRIRTAGLAAMGAGVVALAAWLPLGPLAGGWAARAGTPGSVLAAFNPSARTSTISARPDPLYRAFSSDLSGSVDSGISRDGVGVVDMRLRVTGGPGGVLRIRLGGEPLGGGGLQMESSAVTLGTGSRPAAYQGRVQSLDGTQLRSLVGSADGRALQLQIELSVGDSTATGTLHATPAGGTHG